MDIDHTVGVGIGLDKNRAFSLLQQMESKLPLSTYHLVWVPYRINYQAYLPLTAITECPGFTLGTRD
jgi:hypothetical protein